MTDKTHHRTFEITHGSVRSIHFRKDGRIFLIIVMDSSIELWDVENGFAEITFSLDVSVNKASISSNGKYLGAESRDGTVCIWNISTREVLKRFERSNPYDRYTASPITFSPKDENTFCYSTTEGPQLGKVEGGPCTQCTSKCKNPNVSLSKWRARLYTMLKPNRVKRTFLLSRLILIFLYSIKNVILQSSSIRNLAYLTSYSKVRASHFLAHELELLQAQPRDYLQFMIMMRFHSAHIDT